MSNLDPPPVIGQLVEENSFVDRPAYNHCPPHCPRLFVQAFPWHFAICLAKEATGTGKEHLRDILFSGETKQVTKCDNGHSRRRPRGCRRLEEGPSTQLAGGREAFLQGATS